MVLLKISNKVTAPDSNIVKMLTLSKTKAIYLVTEAIGPALKEEMLEPIHQTENLYTIMFDETTNSKKVKELELAIKFFSERSQKVI